MTEKNGFSRKDMKLAGEIIEESINEVEVWSEKWDWKSAESTHTVLSTQVLALEIWLREDSDNTIKTPKNLV